MHIVNKCSGYVLGSNIQCADTFISRLKGLMCRKGFEEGEGLLLSPCNMIHTFGMRFALDVVYLSGDFKVVHMIENLTPGHMTPMIKQAVSILELPAGMIEKAKIKLGDELHILR